MERARVDPRRTSPAWAARAVDSLLWAGFGAAILIALRDTYISADGLGNAGAAGLAPVWNPNHLLFEPLNALWMRLTGLWFAQVPGVDRLRWLSALYGATALAVFRLGLAPRFTSSRTAAQLATATLAASAGFLQMWLSAECHILQMPFAVAVVIALCRYEERPTARRAAAVALAIAAAALAFVSLCLLALPAAVLILRRSGGDRRRRVLHTALVPALAAALIGGALFLGWRASPRRAPFAAWATSYSGGSAERTKLVYGVQPGAAQIAIAGVRAVYGATSSWVDLTPAIGRWRDHGERALPLTIGGVALLLLLPLGQLLVARPRSISAPLFLPPVLLFGWLWNNSDAQFYLPLSIVLAEAAARLPLAARRSRSALAGILLWNTGSAIERYVLYPRTEWTAVLVRETAGACAVVTPGFDDAGVLLALQGRATLALTGIAVARPAAEGLPLLLADLDRCLQAGGRIELVNIEDRPPREAPWKFLAALGYPPERVRAALAVLPLAPTRSAGPFTLRSATAAAALDR